MIIVPTYTSNVTSNAPAGFITCAQRVISFLQTRYTNPVTHTLLIDYTGNTTFSSYETVTLTYAQIRTAIIARAQTANAITAGGSLPSSDPTGGATCGTTRPMALALGLNTAPGNSSSTFQTNVTWTTDNSSGVPGGTFDLEGVMYHEFTESMGRTRVATNGQALALDLFAYTAANTRTIFARGGYFSIDNGTTNLSTPNLFASSGDPGDWSGAAVDAGNASGTTGVVMPFSEYDITIMDILGWQLSNNPRNVAISKNGLRF